MRQLGISRVIVFWAVSATVMVWGLVATVLLCGKLVSLERAEFRSTTEADAQSIGAQLQTGVLAAIGPLERLGQWWFTQGKPMDREDWATDGQLFMSQSPGLREALWVGTNGRQQWSAVPGGEPNTTSTRPNDRILREIATARDGQRRVISDIFNAPGVGPAFYVCFPMSRGGLIRGYVLGLFDARELLSAIATRSTPAEDRITIAAGGNQIYAVGPAARNAEEKADAAVRLANQVWNLELHAPLHYFRKFRGLILAVIGVIGALIYSFVMLLALSQRWSSVLRRANSALTREVERRVRSEVAVRDLNRELSRRIGDFEVLLDVIPIGIAVADDPECRSIRANRALANMLGMTGGTNISKSGVDAAILPYRIMRNGRDLLPDELPMQVAAATAKTILGEEDRIVRADGTVLDVLSFASPVFDESGRVRGVLNACVDISDHKRLEQGLQKAERMKSLGAMAAGIAHDFNNLLTSIIGQASLAAACVTKESAALGHIAASMDAAQQASSLIHKLLAFTGTSWHTLRPTNLGETIETERTPLYAVAAAKTAIRFDIASRLPDVMADADEVRQVLRNLVLNAVEATASTGGTIEIRVDRCELSGNEPQLMFPQEKFQPGAFVRVEVADTGAGMSPEVAERAFDPFFSTKFLGRGLGLSEVLGIMRAHNGAVRLATAPSAGTSVELFFPAREPLESAGGNPKRRAA